MRNLYRDDQNCMLGLRSRLEECTKLLSDRRPFTKDYRKSVLFNLADYTAVVREHRPAAPRRTLRSPQKSPGASRPS